MMFSSLDPTYVVELYARQETLQREAHDIPLDAVVTDAAWYPKEAAD